MRPDVLETALTDTVNATLKGWPEEGEAEVRAINQQLKYIGTDYEFVSDDPPNFGKEEAA